MLTVAKPTPASFGWGVASVVALLSACLLGVIAYSFLQELGWFARVAAISIGGGTFWFAAEVWSRRVRASRPAAEAPASYVEPSIATLLENEREQTRKLIQQERDRTGQLEVLHRQEVEKNLKAIEQIQSRLTALERDRMDQIQASLEKDQTAEFSNESFLRLGQTLERLVLKCAALESTMADIVRAQENARYIANEPLMKNLRPFAPLGAYDLKSRPPAISAESIRSQLRLMMGYSLDLAGVLADAVNADKSTSVEIEMLDMKFELLRKELEAAFDEDLSVRKRLKLEE